MPAGIPVATVSIGGARDAGLAARCGYLADGGGPVGDRLGASLTSFATGLEHMVLAKHDALRERTGR